MKQVIGWAAAATGVVLMAGPTVADGTEYTATSTWFRVETAKLTGDPAKGASVGDSGTWVAVPSDAGSGGTARMVDGQIELDTDYEAPLAFAPIVTTEPTARISSQVAVTACDELKAGTGTTALCVAPVGESLKWHVWNGSAWNAEKVFSADDVGTAFEVTLETVVTNHTVKYSARKLPDGAAFDICSWTSCATLTAPITNISFYGSTTLGDFAGVGVRKVILAPGVQPENIEIVVIQGRPGSGLVVEKTWMQQQGKTSAEMNNTAANGLTYLQSYVLGLDPKSAVSKPLVTAVQDSTADKVTFRLGGVKVNTSSGARVNYRVKAFAKPDGSELEVTSDPVAADGTVALNLPTSVKYYRIEVGIE